MHRLMMPSLSVTPAYSSRPGRGEATYSRRVGINELTVGTELYRESLEASHTQHGELLDAGLPDGTLARFRTHSTQKTRLNLTVCLVTRHVSRKSVVQTGEIREMRLAFGNNPLVKLTLTTFVLLAIALCPIGETAAQTYFISGSVSDADGEPVPGANVVVKGTRQGATTNRSGLFAISDAPNGEQVLVVSFLGYRPVEQTITVSAQTPRIEIILSESAIYILDEIVVEEEGYAIDRTTATRTNTRLQDLPQSVQIINGDLVEDQGLTYLTDALQNVSGVSPFSEYLDFNMRGFRTTGDAAVKQDGLNQVHGFFQRMRLEDVERIEVVKGPAGALYGQSRPGGFINVISKQPSARQKSELKLTLGSYSKSQANFNSTGPVPVSPGFGKLLYKINAGHANDDGFRQNESFIHSNFKGSLTWLPTDQTSVTLAGEWFDELNRGHRNRGVPFFNQSLVDLPIDYTINEPDDFISIEAYVYRLRTDHRFSDKLKLDASASYLTNQRRQEYHEPRGLLEDGRTMKREFRDQYREKQQTALNTNLIYDAKAGRTKHTLLTGFEYTLTKGLRRTATARDSSRGGPVPNIDIFNPVFAPENRPLKFTYYGEDIPQGISQLSSGLDNRVSAYGFYLQDQVNLGRRFDVLLGLRYDRFEDKARSGSGNQADDSNWSLRGGAVFKPIETLSTYLSYSEGFEPVSSAFTFDPDRYGGPFDPEKSWTIEGGAKSSFLNDRLNATVAVYHITKQDVLLRDPNPPENQPDRRIQVGEIESQGFEMDAAGVVNERWSLHASYARSIKAEITEDTNPDNIGDPNPGNPMNTFGFWSRYDIPIDDSKRIGFGLGGSYVGERFTFTDGDNLPSYFVANGGIFIRYDRFDITANLHNLFDKEYFPGGYGGRIGGFRGTPRSVDVTVRYGF